MCAGVCFGFVFFSTSRTWIFSRPASVSPVRPWQVNRPLGADSPLSIHSTTASAGAAKDEMTTKLRVSRTNDFRNDEAMSIKGLVQHHELEPPALELQLEQVVGSWVPPRVVPHISLESIRHTTRSARALSPSSCFDLRSAALGLGAAAGLSRTALGATALGAAAGRRAQGMPALGSSSQRNSESQEHLTHNY